MIIESVAFAQVLAPLIAGLAAVVLYHYIGREYLGAAENEYWNALRIFILSAGDSTIRSKTNFALTNPALESHKVGRVRLSSLELAQHLESQGYVQNVIAGLKYRPTNINPNKSSQVSFEDGSMAFRESKSDLIPDVLATRQVHVWWFENGDGTLDVYAHEEYSSLNPLVAWKHYTATDWNPELGGKIVTADLDAEGVDIEL